MPRSIDSVPSLTDADLQALAEFRYRIRRFLRFSEEAAREAGLEPQQHQLLLAAAGAAHGPATVGALAERLQLRPHSVDELITRAEANGLVSRHRSDEDRRYVLVEPTAEGRRALDRLSDSHRAELRGVAEGLVEALTRISGDLGADA
ncbi:MAG: MarR family transcriptional regulator [Chloroflexota bacterium]